VVAAWALGVRVTSVICTDDVSSHARTVVDVEDLTWVAATSRRDADAIIALAGDAVDRRRGRNSIGIHEQRQMTRLSADDYAHSAAFATSIAETSRSSISAVANALSRLDIGASLAQLDLDNLAHGWTFGCGLTCAVTRGLKPWRNSID
jgi:hypothetical protein